MDLEHFLAQLPKGDLWIFGYGSLMWSPGFSYKQKAPGRLHGYHRALCILSSYHIHDCSINHVCICNKNTKQYSRQDKKQEDRKNG